MITAGARPGYRVAREDMKRNAERRRDAIERGDHDGGHGSGVAHVGGQTHLGIHRRFVGVVDPGEARELSAHAFA